MLMKRMILFLALTTCATTSEVDPAMPLDGSVMEYDRSDWRHWIDADKDCQDTRQEVLIEESKIPVTFKDERGCKVASGEWEDPYTGRVFTDPSILDVDHMVALKDAHDSGGYAWDAERKKAFANDLSNPNHLIAVYRSANRSKGSRGPDEWLPTNAAYRCEYIKQWSTVKTKWNLTMSDAEARMVEYMLRVCDSGCAPALPQ